MARADEVAVIKGRHLPLFDAVEGTFIEAIPKALITGAAKSVSPVVVSTYDLSDSPSEEALLSKFRNARPDLVFAIGATALDFARRIEGVPIVYALAPADREAQNATARLAGIDLLASPTDWVEATAAMLPGRVKIGMVTRKGGAGAWAEGAGRLLAARGMRLIAVEAEAPEKVRAALSLLRGRVDALWLMADPQVLSQESIEEILLFGLENKLPVVGFSRKYLKAGAALTVEPDLGGVGAQAATLAARILSGGYRFSGEPAFSLKSSVEVNPGILEALGIPLQRGATGGGEPK